MSWRHRRLRVGAFLAAATAASGCSFEALTRQEEAIKAQWGQVENRLQRRSDLISDLARTVEGLAERDGDLVQAVADAGAKTTGVETPADAIAAANEESMALSRLLHAVGNDPQLRLDETLARVVDELALAEHRLSTERLRYNERVQEYDVLRREFPSSVTASVLGFEDYPHFDVPAPAEPEPAVASDQ